VKRPLKGDFETKSFEDTEQKLANAKYRRNINSISDDYVMENAKLSSNSGCKLKYQQATVDVCTRIMCLMAYIVLLSEMSVSQFLNWRFHRIH